MTRLAVVALLALAACSNQQLERACEDIEPWRPLIRGAIELAEPVAAIPFAFTRQVHCADIEAVAERLRDQR